MKSDIAKKWLDYAKAELEAAEILVKNTKSKFSYQLAVLHCHQAIEKILKTTAVSKGLEPKRTHDLVKLFSDSKLRISPEFQEYIKKLNAHYQPARYPDIHYKNNVIKYDKATGLYHFKQTNKLFGWLEKELKSKK